MSDKKKILVIDDEPDMVDMLKTALQMGRYDVVTGKDGQEAVEKARSEKPDAIILDLMMPGKNGFEAMKEIRSDASTAGIPILVLTAIGEHLAHSRYARNMGLDIDSEDFITKPVDAKDLLGRVKAVLV
jgi:two-component system alkaline phosphatase synthesis response regulator PhoP